MTNRQANAATTPARTWAPGTRPRPVGRSAPQEHRQRDGRIEVATGDVSTCEDHRSQDAADRHGCESCTGSTAGHTVKTRKNVPMNSTSNFTHICLRGGQVDITGGVPSLPPYVSPAATRTIGGSSPGRRRVAKRARAPARCGSARPPARTPPRLLGRPSLASRSPRTAGSRGSRPARGRPTGVQHGQARLRPLGHAHRHGPVELDDRRRRQRAEHPYSAAIRAQSVSATVARRRMAGRDRGLQGVRAACGPPQVLRARSARPARAG